MKLLVNFLLVLLGLLLLWMSATGGSELVVLGQTIGLRNSTNPTILLALLSALKLYKYTDFSYLSHSNRAYQLAFKSVLFFILVVLAVKTFVGLITTHHFHLLLDAEDWKHTYSTDLSFALIAVLTLGLLGWLAKITHQLLLFRVVANIALSTLALLGLAAGIAYVFIGMTYFVWGSYIEPQHFAAMRMAGVGPESVDLLVRWPTLLAIIAIIVLWNVAQYISKLFAGKGYRAIAPTALAIILLPALLTANVPVNFPTKVAPSVQSPLLLFVRPVSGDMNGVNANHLLARFGHSDFEYKVSENKPAVLDKFKGLAGIAKGKNVIFYVMESVRRRNLELYGYARSTMPALTALAENALVFDQAYVMQPRSSKAMSALALGITPDPRLRPLSWFPERIKGQDNLFRRLIDDGRRFYIGTGQPYGGDNLQEFFLETSDARAEQVIAFEDLKKDEQLSNDDLGLIEHFSHWANASDTPFVGLLWTECAHIPYAAPLVPFGFKQLVDKYDNCLHTVDTALSNLLENLSAAGKLDDTLLVILGDHGEALGEKFDMGHGNYLYEHSLRIPMLIYSPTLFEQRIDITPRFQLKDLASTLLYLLGLPDKINQSVNILSIQGEKPLYFSNVYQDFKLGFLDGQIKFVYRPIYDLVSIYDLANDPQENTNIANNYSRDQLAKMKIRSLKWYKYHTQYVDEHYPKVN